MLTSQVARLIGCSPATIRGYTRLYAASLSPTANPPQGTTRSYTPEDIRLLAFVASQTGEGITHAEIAGRIAAGEWKDHPLPAGAAADTEPEPQPEPSALMLTAGQLTAALERESALHSQIAQMAQELGMARGELTALKAQMAQERRPWYQRLLGL